MSAFKNAYLENEIKRWMRPDAHRFVRPDWRCYVAPGSDLWSLYELYERKYSADQPRVPAGSSEGGQWTNGDGTESGESQSRVVARISPGREAECEFQYRQDTFICNLVGTRSCWAQAMFRRAQCLIGGYVPPLYH